MDRSFLVAQTTATIPGPTPLNLVKLAKPDPNQAVTIALNGAVEIDLSAIANTPVTFVQASAE